MSKVPGDSKCWVKVVKLTFSCLFEILLPLCEISYGRILAHVFKNVIFITTSSQNFHMTDELHDMDEEILASSLND